LQGTFDYLAFSSLSKMQSTLLTFPYQVLRTRLQDQHSQYSGLVDCTLRTVRGEGLQGIFCFIF
jgi:solute carrier family 25 folate transporter 32